MRKPYHQLTVQDYLQRMEPRIGASLNAEQVAEFSRLLQQAIPKPAPKIVDLRVNLDLILLKYYVVIFVGRDYRKSPRRYAAGPMTRAGNLVAACLLILALNLMVTASVFMVAYLLKSAFGINLFPGHLYDYL